jgi:hypothetical protein
MIKLQFVCGHEIDATGNEEQPRCSCGETRIERVDACPPKFRGHVRGPLATFKDLPARPVKLGK